MRSIELFAGAGGLGIGASEAGFHPAKVVEWDDYCVETIRENQQRRLGIVKGWPVVHGDVRHVDFSPHHGQVDLVSGGPPCQPFSLGGKHRAHKDSRDLWSEAVRAVRETQPRVFIFENVKGLLRDTFASYVSYIQLQMQYPSLDRKEDEDWADHLSRLERHHTSGKEPEYRLVMRLQNAANFGVPQRRERVFFVGFRADLGIEWNFPDQTHSLDALIWDQVVTGAYWERNKVATRDRVINPRHEARAKVLQRTFGGLPEGTSRKPWRTVREALAGLPDPELNPEVAAELLNHRFQAGARSYPGHTGSPLDEPAKTLKAGVHGVPGGENMLLRPDGSVRYFTVRESARLQTFPDKYKFHGSWSETMRQLGNAVPVQLAAVVARDVATHLQSA
ncbi:DNA cytosine methyltransferase [Sphingomonas arenae]|uniref:DNA cytosine methyltransferase n=1 Tax=Sphingomonas arenae TaxID=2812555 RepID=UPI0019671008|nr:DNA cytosine methyltransferase [Sphingomonas arenae]